MDIQTYLDNLPTGEVVTNRRALCAMKRKGLIVDYSPWCYLEDKRVWYIRWETECIGKIADSMYYYFCRELKDGEKGTRDNPFGSFAEMLEAMPRESGFYYRGHYFTSKYLDGCFNAYLIKSEPPMSGNVNRVRRSMSVFGAIV